MLPTLITAPAASVVQISHLAQRVPRVNDAEKIEVAVAAWKAECAVLLHGVHQDQIASAHAA